MFHDPYKYFRIEGRDIVSELGKGVLALEKGGPEPDLVARMFRLAHTLKGAARVVKQREIAEHAHSIEDALTPFREGARMATRDQVDGVLHHLDAISARVTALNLPSPAPNVAPSPARPEPFRTLSADVGEMDALLDGVTEVGVRLATVRKAAGSLGRVRHLADLLGDQLVCHQLPGSANGATPKGRSIADELEALVSSVERDLAVALEQTDRELGQVRDATERLRLLPVGLMFGALERAARDAAVSVGKRVTFESRGGEVRLDADMLTAVQSALVQAVRNAVDHGIEPESERTLLGKPAEGRITVEVVRRGNRVSFTCRDDGRGVDLEAVRRAAKQRGALASDAEEAGSEDLLRILLKGGISTSHGVTAVSGRGVGLDVVRATAIGLGGVVDLRTRPNEGTVLEIVAPVSLSSVDALVVEAGGQLAAIPLDAVRRTLRLSPTDVTHTAEGDAIIVDGTVIPFAPLARAFRQPARTATASRRSSAVVIETHGTLAAIGVDRLVGTENIVLHPLPALTPLSSAVSGVSLDAEGNPRMVLDPDGLLTEARRAEGGHDDVAQRSAILVIDDSLTTRMLEQSILESAGYEVDLATSAEEGLEKARRRPYRLFLVDVEMPGMDGFTFIEQTRSDPSLQQVPAILVSSRASADDRDRGVAVGASAYIVKGDFDQTELLARIGTLLR